MTLTEIENLWALIEEKLDESGGEETEEISALLAQFDLAQSDKVDGYIAVIDRLRDDEMAADARATEYRHRADRAAQRREWLKQRLAWHMDRVGIREIKGQLRKAKWTKNGGQAPLVGPGIDDPTKLPYEYQKVTVEADKQKLREALVGDDRLDKLVRAGERGESLRIY